MAVVFISPKQRQRMFITGIASIFGLIVVIIAAIVFFSQPGAVAPELVFNKPKVTIDFSVLDSEQFGRLNEFKQMENRYTYEATVLETNEKVTGFTTAASYDDAKKKVEEMGYRVDKLEEVDVGRTNPFEPYYGENLNQIIPTEGSSSGSGTSPLQGLNQQQYDEYMQYLNAIQG
ncbi:MAG TPA: hypothetical protein PLF16_00405, partial [Candidatus Staskawiczbacteria bacterium]|nr:hypothetical protein [Candidatus Staskawiczbacteria bacterium]